MTVNLGGRGVGPAGFGVTYLETPGSIGWQTSFHYGKDAPQSVSVGSDGLIDAKPIVISGRKAERCVIATECGP